MPVDMLGLFVGDLRSSNVRRDEVIVVVVVVVAYLLVTFLFVQYRRSFRLHRVHISFIRPCCALVIA